MFANTMAHIRVEPHNARRAVLACATHAVLTQCQTRSLTQNATHVALPCGTHAVLT